MGANKSVQVANESVQVANAFPNEVWVKASPKHEVFHGGVKATAIAAAKKRGETNGDSSAMRNHGFLLIKTNEVLILTPNCGEKDSVFITVVSFSDHDDTENIIQNNERAIRKTAVIITATGEVVAAKGVKKDSWLDYNNKDHKADPCDMCQSQKQVCDLCLVDNKMQLIQQSIGAVYSSQVAKDLMKTIEKMGKAKLVKKETEVRETIAKVEELAKLYWVLEAKTKTSVSDVKAYGEHVKEAGEDFLKDKIFTDFWQEMSNIDDMEKSIKEANSEHARIKGEVKLIETKANTNVAIFQEKVDTADEKGRKDKKYLESLKFDDSNDGLQDATALATFASVPVIGQLGGLAVGSFLTANLAVEGCTNSKNILLDNNLSKLVVGATAGLGGGLAGMAAATLTLPAAPFLLFKALSSFISSSSEAAEDYRNLVNEFENIAVQMGLVEQHLTNINLAISDIQTRLKATMHGQKNMAACGEESRIKMVNKVIASSSQLIKSCDNYFNFTSREEGRHIK